MRPGFRAARVRPTVEQLESREMLDAAFTQLLVQYRDSNSFQTVEIPEGVAPEAALAASQTDPNVLRVEPDLPLAATVIPNDPSFGLLYGLHNDGQTGGPPDADIDAPQAWDVTTGSTKTVVAVIDTGVDYTHPDLYLNIWINQGEIPASRRANLIDLDGDGLITFRDLNEPVNQGVGKITDLNHNGYIDAGDLLQPMNPDGTGGWEDGVDSDRNGYTDDLVGWDFANNDNDPFDDHGHGTHVAGTIGAVGNNGIGVAGINWAVQIMAVKFLSASGGGSTSNAARAVTYAASNGASISNNSWGGGGYSQVLYNAISTAGSMGHIFVAAAGNDGSNSPNYPALYDLPNIVAVAATDSSDSLAYFSNYNATTVDLAAPGSAILSTYPGNRYATMSGTSMATPHVTGVIALVRGLHPDWSASQVIEQVKNTVDLIPGLSGKTATGGRVNAARAVGNTVVSEPPSPPLFAPADLGTPLPEISLSDLVPPTPRPGWRHRRRLARLVALRKRWWFQT